MNKWVKRGYLGIIGLISLAMLVVLVLSPWRLVSILVMSITIWLAVILIGISLFKKNLTDKQRYVIIGIIILGYLYVQTFAAPCITGRVVDKTTQKPIENAIIHVEYCLSLPTIISGGVPSRMGERLAVTDKDGRYKIGPKIGINFLYVSDPRVYIKILHPLWEAKQKDIYLTYTWEFNKFPAPIRYDEEMFSLGEKYRDNYETTIRSGVCHSFGGELSEFEDYFKYAKRFNMTFNYKEIRYQWSKIIGDHIDRLDIDRVFGVKPESEKDE